MIEKSKLLSYKYGCFYLETRLRGDLILFDWIACLFPLWRSDGSDRQTGNWMWPSSSDVNMCVTCGAVTDAIRLTELLLKRLDMSYSSLDSLSVSSNVFTTTNCDFSVSKQICQFLGQEMAKVIYWVLCHHSACAAPRSPIQNPWH